MAEIPPDVIDIFISYGHIDNQSLISDEPGWISLLHERLDIKLYQMLGRKIKIWRDTKLRGNDEFGDELVEQVSKARLMISIISPKYVESSWCIRELETFSKSRPDGLDLRIKNTSRVFKVVKTFLKRENHPEQLKGQLGYVFYEENPAKDDGIEFDTGKEDKRYWAEFQNLASDIKNAIEVLDAELASGKIPSEAASVAVSAPKTPPDSTKATIYLAATTSDLRFDRDQIKAELEDFGYLVLPDMELPENGPAMIEKVREYLKSSDFSIHMIGANYGLRPAQEERSIVHLQEDLAVERAADSTLQRLIWIPPGIVPADPLQTQFIENLTNSSEALKNSELVRTRLEDLKTIIQAMLTRKSDQSIAENGGHDKSMVYLACDQIDIESVKPIYDYLYDEGYEVVFSPDEAPSIEEYQSTLQSCDAVLYYYGNVNETWLRPQFMLLEKASAGRNRPLQSVYVASPKTTKKEMFRTREALLIKNFADFNPEALKPFIQQLKESKGV